jgi:hypothetical protein
MSGSDCPVDRVVEGVPAARAAGLELVKVKMVVKRDATDVELRRMGPSQWAGWSERYSRSRPSAATGSRCVEMFKFGGSRSADSGGTGVRPRRSHRIVCLSRGGGTWISRRAWR